MVFVSFVLVFSWLVRLEKHAPSYDSGLRKRTYPKNPYLYLFQSWILHLPVISAAIIHIIEQRFKLRHVSSIKNRFFEDPFVKSKLGHSLAIQNSSFRKHRKNLYFETIECPSNSEMGFKSSCLVAYSR